MNYPASIQRFSASPGGVLARAHRAWPLLWPVVPVVLAAHQLPVLPSGWQIAATGLAGLFCALSRRKWLVAPAVALIFLSWTWWQAQQGLAQRIVPAQEGQDLRVSGWVENMPRAGRFGPNLRFQITDCAWLDPEYSAACPSNRSISLNWGRADRADSGSSTDPEPSMPAPGSRWSLVARLKRPHSVLNPGGYDGELAALAGGIAARAYVRRRHGPPIALQLAIDNLAVRFERARSFIRLRMNAALRQVPRPVAGTLLALVVGEQGAIPPRTWQAYQQTGVGHLMSISGLHITMLAGLALWLVRRALRVSVRHMPELASRHALRVLAWWPALATAFVYSIFSGWGIPAQRTCWMLAAAAFSATTSRGRSLPHVLSLAAALVIIADPWAPLSPGFWLSFAAVAAIVVQGAANGLKRRAWWRAAIGTQWAATVAMLPLGAVFFSSFSLLGPLANAFAIPLVSILITPCALIGGLLCAIWPWAGEFVLVPAIWMTHMLIVSLQALSELDGTLLGLAPPPAWALLLAALGAAALLSPSRPVSRSLAIVPILPLLLLKPSGPGPGHWRLTAIDVGQGNAVLVETANHRLLYDTGPSYGADSDAGLRHVLPALRAMGVARINRLVVSHEDNDHAGGAGSLLAAIAVDRVQGSLRPTHRLAGLSRVAPCLRGQRWVWDGVEFEWLHPGPERLAARANARRRTQFGGNSSSCVLMVRSASASLLLAGDIERAQERELLTVYGAAGLQADVLLAPHHGSGTSSSLKFLQAVSPQHAVFQVGYRNRFSHPKASVLRRYQQMSIQIWRSDAHANIRIEPGPAGHLQVRAMRLHSRRYWRLMP